MKVWIRQIARLAGLTGACLMLAAGALLGLGVTTLVLRSLIVGVVLYVAVAILGRLAGETILGVAVEHCLKRRGAASPAAEAERAAPAGRSGVRAA